MKEILVVGSLNMDLVFSVDHYPGVGETMMSSGFAVNPGGKGANQAYAAGRLGSCVHMIGCVGRDDYGRALRANLESAGVNTAAVETVPETPTGVAGIAVSKAGDNSIIVVPGANYRLTPDVIEKHDAMIRQADYVIAQLEIPVDSVLALARRAGQYGKVMILDPAPARADLPDELFPLIDILKPNETELQILTGMPADTQENIVAAARQLIGRGVRCVIVTLGARGAMIVDAETSQMIPGEKVKPVDTTAAGDTFTAAVACGLTSGLDLTEAVRFANKVSAVVVTRRGAQTSIPDRNEIQKVLNEVQK